MNSQLFATNRVLIPIDFSEASLQAQALTLDFVKDPSHLHVLHVIPHLNPGEPGVIWNRLDDQTRKQHVYQLFKQRFNRSEYEQVSGNSERLSQFKVICEQWYLLLTSDF